MLICFLSRFQVLCSGDFHVFIYLFCEIFGLSSSGRRVVILMMDLFYCIVYFVRVVMILISFPDRRNLCFMNECVLFNGYLVLLHKNGMNLLKKKYLLSVKYKSSKVSSYMDDSGMLAWAPPSYNRWWRSLVMRY